MSDNDTSFKDVLATNWHLVRINPNPNPAKGGSDYFIETDFDKIVEQELDAYLVVKTESGDQHYNGKHPQIVFGKWGALGFMRPARMNNFWEIIKDNQNFFVWNPATSNWDKIYSLRNSIAPHDKNPTIVDKKLAEDAFDSMKEQFGKYLKKQQEILQEKNGGKKSKKAKRTKARKPVKKQRKTRNHKK